MAFPSVMAPWHALLHTRKDSPGLNRLLFVKEYGTLITHPITSIALRPLARTAYLLALIAAGT